MFHRSKHFLMAAGVLTLSAVSTITLAHTYERCDADGDHCVRVNCDNDGDKCHYGYTGREHRGEHREHGDRDD